MGSPPSHPHSLNHLEPRLLLAAAPTIPDLLPLAQVVPLEPAGIASVEGHIDPGECPALYAFTAQAKGKVYVDLLAGDGALDPYLTVYKSNGRRLRRNDNAHRRTADSRIRLRVKPGQTYYIAAEGADETYGAYTLRLSSVPRDDHGDTFPAAKVLRQSRRGRGRGRGRINYGSDVDVFVVTAKETGSMKLSLTVSRRTPDLQGMVYVYDADGNMLSASVPVRYEDGCTIDCEIVAGEVYYVKAVSPDDSTGKYGVAVTTEPERPELPQPVVGPIYHESYYRGERELFGYAPRFEPNVVSFDAQNRPYMRTLGSGGLTAYGTIQTLVGGKWIALDFVSSIRAALPDWEGPFRADCGSEQRIVFDTGGDAYMAVETPDYSLLLHSRDQCRTWSVYNLPDPHVKFEFQDGNNVLSKPPAILSYAAFGSATELRLTVPLKNADGTLTIPDPLVVSQAAWAVTNQSGAANTMVTIGDYTHIVWAGAVEVPGQTGTPQYAATYNRLTGELSKAVLLGFGGTGEPDPHNLPSICADSQGHLHVILGVHHGQLKYIQSLQPNDSASGWTQPVLLGTTDPSQDGRYTYVSLICDQNDALHLVTRSVDEWYHFELAYLRKTPGEDWEDPQLLVSPFRRYYGTWYQKLNIDRQGRLFVNYAYYGNQLTEEEAAVYRQKWPDEQISLPPDSGPGRNNWLGVRPHDPAMLVSDDGGDTWRLAVTADFLEGVQ